MSLGWNYPAGLEHSPHAPWNQKEPALIERWYVATPVSKGRSVIADDQYFETETEAVAHLAFLRSDLDPEDSPEDLFVTSDEMPDPLEETRGER